MESASWPWGNQDIKCTNQKSTDKGFTLEGLQQMIKKKTCNKKKSGQET